MHLVLNLCDDIYVLDFGKVAIAARAAVDEVKTDRTVAAAYLGQFPRRCRDELPLRVQRRLKAGYGRHHASCRRSTSPPMPGTVHVAILGPNGCRQKRRRC